MTGRKKSSSSSRETSAALTEFADDLSAFNAVICGATRHPKTVSAALRYVRSMGFQVDAVMAMCKPKEMANQNPLVLAMVDEMCRSQYLSDPLKESDKKKFEKKSALLEELEAFGEE